MFEKLNDYIISLKKQVYRLHLLDNLNGNSKEAITSFYYTTI